MRIKIIRLVIIVFLLTIVGDLFYLQVIRGNFYFNLSQNNSIRVIPLEGRRGQIFDRNGELLAGSRIAYNVMITPQDIKDLDELLVFLSGVLKTDKSRLMDQYKRNKTAPFAPVVIDEDVSKASAILIEENKYKFPSLIVQESFRRVYPKGAYAGHVTGYVGKINKTKMLRAKEYGYSPQSIVGYTGVEEFYNDNLTGAMGGLQVEVDSRGRQVRLLSLKDPVQGEDITLTLDSNIQQASMDLLQNRRGVIVVMDMDTGEILGLTSSPGYDPNIFVDEKIRKKSASVLSQEGSPLLNRAIKGLYPPGSVFKIPVGVCALSNKKITQHTSFFCDGVLELGGIRFGCTHQHGQQDLIDAIAHSCNIYFYKISLLVGSDAIDQYAKWLGLGRKTHVDLPYEEGGFVPSKSKGFLSMKRNWYTGDTLNLSIGQGDVLVTPIQLARMMATIANNGIEVQPHVIKTIGDKVVKKYDFKRPVNIDQKTLNIIQAGLRETVTRNSATAHLTDIEGIAISGKTGTAQSTKNQEEHAWFAGYAKGKKKNISFCVFLEFGGSSQNAVLLTRQLLLYLQGHQLI